MILDSITDPSILKTLTTQKLQTLCSELRSEIVNITAKNGGHLGSNLGIIEIIVAAHYVFNCGQDKFIFDVGHQAYAHKLLTGRRAIMKNLRSTGGASGFPDPGESQYDHFIAGHASTSLSAALGIAKARDLSNSKFSVVSFLGDGSLSGGMIYEAMNNVGDIGNFVVILNDNKMSISESVGAMRRYLSKLLSSKSSMIVRKRISRLLDALPSRSARVIEHMLRHVVSAVGVGNIFEEFGFHYVGPIDGHDLERLISVLQNVRDVANYKPVIIHAVTKKGYGYGPAETDSTNLHGIEHEKSLRYCDVFGKKVVELATHDERIVCITAAMKEGCGLSDFASMFPTRFFDVGIAEEHAVTFAAGLASQGFKPFVCIYSTFLQRSFDQIYHDVVLPNLPVRFIIDKAGLPGKDGKTHAGLYDVALLQNFENVTIMAPSSATELEGMLEFAATSDVTSPIAIRFSKTKATMSDCTTDTFDLRCRVVIEGKDTLIVVSGNLLTNVLEAVKISHTSPTVIDARIIHPFDFETFYRHTNTHDRIIVIEEGVFGGLSNVLLNELTFTRRSDIIANIEFVNISKTPPQHSHRTEQLKANRMSVEDLVGLLKRGV
ncbi:MAG: 1-deoxy-D-xylulose-5-phosphate synthase [Holosporales bacterium]|jgi:1-deoxy-D-xylulose-5-phosphate synthase|nr:1-deoxy-D-xylulose-5-phosphate synthase [Holosporales bacterium]